MKMIDWKRYALEEYSIELTTTFGNDFDIAESFGMDAIRDTFNRAFAEWKSDYRYLTELVLILNWKTAQHYKTNRAMAELYNELWEKADGYAVDNLTGDELAYFYRITD